MQGAWRFESWVRVSPAPADGEDFVTANVHRLTPCPDDERAQGQPSHHRLEGEAVMNGRPHPDLGPVWRLCGSYRAVGHHGEVEITVAPDGRGWAVFRANGGGGDSTT